MTKRSFKRFVEQELGKLPEFLIYALLEWILIIILFIDGFLAFIANEFAKIFELNIPCLLCTRIDHVFVHRNPDFYYNESICDSHRKTLSSLAYCHMHKKLSEIRKMCEGCLLSFATEKESNCDSYKSLEGILHKDIKLLFDDEQELHHLVFPASGSRKDENVIQQNVDQKNNNKIINTIHQQQQRCSCCGKLLKVKSCKPNNASQAPAPSPRVSFNRRNLELPHTKYTELNKLYDTEPEVQEDKDSVNAINRVTEDIEPSSIPLLTDPDEATEEKTPSFIRGTNRFFGIPLSDSTQNSPPWSMRSIRKSMLERTDSASSPSDPNGPQQDNTSDGDFILHHLKTQVHLDRKSLMALYMELDEERSASAVAANNAMAMITRVQAEKAAVQMEALQYQRMMEEQAEYDQEALQDMKDLLLKREEEIKELGAELETYREKYGCFREEKEGGGEEGFIAALGDVTTDDSDNYRDLKPGLNDLVYSSSEGSNCEEKEVNNININHNIAPNGEETSRLGEMKHLDKKLQVSSSDEAPLSVDESRTNNGNIMQEEEEKGSKTMLTKELLDIQERLNALESEGSLLKHVSEVLDASEGEAILTQISQNLHMLRSFVAMPVSDN